MNELARQIQDEIRRTGPLPFHRFMARALYCPDLGYYDRFPHTIGRAGDYFTNVSVGPLFGELLALQGAHWIETVDLAAPWHWVEAGAHEGRLAHDILTWLHRQRPALARQLEYWIQEPSRRRQAWQRENLAAFVHQVKWFEDWNSGPPGGFQGVVLSNELLDAFPVHRLGWDLRQRTWFEWGVDIDGDKFSWVRLPAPGNLSAASPEQIGWPRDGFPPPDLLDCLPDGFTVEASPAAVRWWQQAARSLRRGWIVTFDYGLEHTEFFAPHRREGTLRGYRSQHPTALLLENPGEQDLTAHVNFTAVRQAGAAEGLTTEYFGPQGRFLTRVAEMAWQPASPMGPWSRQRTRQFQTLTHPDHLGHRFSVLLQKR